MFSSALKKVVVGGIGLHFCQRNVIGCENVLDIDDKHKYMMIRRWETTTKKGDWVVYHDPNFPEESLEIGQVVALPSEIVYIKGEGKDIVPKGHYWIIRNGISKMISLGLVEGKSFR